MRGTTIFAVGLALSASLGSAAAWANDNVIKLSSDPNNWVLQNGDYAGHRYSKLDQITTDNVGQLKVAWTFSTAFFAVTRAAPSSSAT